MWLLIPLTVLLPAQQLQIDPLLLVQAKEIWSVIGRSDNPVWPGWDARETPILIYFPGKQDVLVNHPKPPEGFTRYTGPIDPKMGSIYFKNGPTIFDFDGQNTSTDVNGIQTLVIADTLSSRRQWVAGLAPSLAAKPLEADKVITDSLFPNPFDSMTMFAHEAFHAYQHKAAPTKGGNELALLGYPSLSVTNNVGFALESDFLAAALRAKTTAEARAAALKWLATRRSRQQALPKDCAAYENGTEFNEGLAKYVEYRMLQSLEGRKASPEMWLVQGFTGYDDLTSERERLIKRMQGFMSGESVVNNDLYGASPVRFRLYYSGMAIGALLDRLGLQWHDRILKTDANLSSLAEEAIKATPAELEQASKEIQSSTRYAELSKEKEKLAADGQKHVEEALAEFTNAPGELVIDYSKLEKPQVGFAFTPFGILRVDDDRVVFRLLPIRGKVGDLVFSEDTARPVLHNRKAKTVHIQLTGSPESTLSGALSGKVSMPGVTLNNLKGTMRKEGKRWILELTP